MPLDVWETGGTASRSGRFTLEGRQPGTKRQEGHGGKDKRITTFVPGGNHTPIIHSVSSTHGQSRTSSVN